MSARVLRLGTRRSALAMAQAAGIARRIEIAAKEAHDDIVVELVGLSSLGDETSAPLTSLGGTGVFVSRLRRAIAAAEVDAAVHSLKDLPTAPADGIELAAVPEREDPRDVLISRPGLRLVEPAAGAEVLLPGARVRIGTGSPRRAAQLAALARQRGLHVEIHDIRGNVDSRIRQVGVDTGDGAVVDAVVLARAGLLRLGRQDEISETLPTDIMLPAPGQGALALECRTDAKPWVRAALRRVHDEDAGLCVTAERTVLAAVEAGCAAPLGALAEIVDAVDGAASSARHLLLRAVVARPDGAVVLHRRVTLDLDPGRIPPGTDAASLAHAAALDLAAGLLADGAGELIGLSAGVSL